MTESLRASLQRAAERLTEHVLAEMYEDPFWRDRFGARADTHGRQDGKFHIDYLCESLASNDPEVMTRYARWLQQVLTTRGMCTRHLADHFMLLARAIGAQGWADAGLAVTVLAAATEALRYADGPARIVQDAGPAAATAALARLPAIEEARRPLALRELAYLADYTVDAIALATPKVAHDRAAWAETFYGLSATTLRRALREAFVAAVPAQRGAVESTL